MKELREKTLPIHKILIFFLKKRSVLGPWVALVIVFFLFYFLLNHFLFKKT
jgi:hypothetical protein